MSNIDKQALREEFQYMQDHYSDPADRARQVIYIAAEALLDERERNQQYIKRRDQENEDIALTVGKLRVELEAAKKSMTEQSAIVAAAEKLVRCKGRYHSGLNYRALAAAPKPQNVPQNIPENIPSGKSTLTPDGWISCSEQMPSAWEQVLAYRPDAPESNDPLIKMATYVGGSAHGHGFDCYCNQPTGCRCQQHRSRRLTVANLQLAVKGE
ncbi:ead/Ea22-like family protein [Salmonella enterica]|uniref:ead/Ea22-like family protein n=1 Tax=Salmonella enterica TaxID=28901 RepID=UPI0014383E74